MSYVTYFSNFGTFKLHCGLLTMNIHFNNVIVTLITLKVEVSK